MGLYTARQTFYIGKDGKILFVETKVRPDSAGADLVERLLALGLAKR